MSVRALALALRVLGNRAVAPSGSLENMPATKSGDPSAVQASPKIDSIVSALPTATEVKSWSAGIWLAKLTLHYERYQAEARALQPTEGRERRPITNLATSLGWRTAENLCHHHQVGPQYVTIFCFGDMQNIIYTWRYWGMSFLVGWQNNRGTTSRKRWGLTVMSDEHRKDLTQPSTPVLCLSKVYTGAKYKTQLCGMTSNGITVCCERCERQDSERVTRTPLAEVIGHPRRLLRKVARSCYGCSQYVSSASNPPSVVLYRPHLPIRRYPIFAITDVP